MLDRQGTASIYGRKRWTEIVTPPRLLKAPGVMGFPVISIVRFALRFRGPRSRIFLTRQPLDGRIQLRALAFAPTETIGERERRTKKVAVRSRWHVK